MGNLKKGTAVEERVVFTGNQQDFEKFRTWFHNEMDEKDRQWITLAAQAIAKVFQDIVAERTAKGTTTPMQTDLHKFLFPSSLRPQDTSWIHQTVKRPVPQAVTSCPRARFQEMLPLQRLFPSTPTGSAAVDRP